MGIGMRVTIAAGLLIASAGIAAAQDPACPNARFQLFPGETTRGSLEVRRDRPCRINVGVGGTGSIDTITIVTPAANGVAGVARRALAYAPRAGYVGTDRFVFEVVWTIGATNERRSARVDFAVTVTP